MALIKCPECGRDISDKAKSCPHCGYPVFQKSQGIYETQDLHPIQASIVEPEKTNGWKIGLASFIVSFFGFILSIAGTTVLGFIGIIIAIVSLAKKEEKKWIPITAIIISMFGFLLSPADNKKDNNVNVTETVVETHTNGEDENLSVAVSEDIVEPEVKNDKIIPEQPPVEIFATDLLNSWSDYIGKIVTVSYACGRCEDDEQSIQSVYDDDARLYLRSYVDNYRQFEYGDYITVTGLVDSQYSSYIEIKNAHIDYFGNESQAVYDAGKSDYDERKRVESEEYEAAFRENAESPSYDDLLRYPDSYKEKQIKVKVKVVRVEPDGIIFDGDIEATMSGEQVALYDGRTTKEPKLREGDSVTIYGYGKGTTTVKVQDVSGLLPKTVDKYDIPAIDMRYIDFQK